MLMVLLLQCCLLLLVYLECYNLLLLALHRGRKGHLRVLLLLLLLLMLHLQMELQRRGQTVPLLLMLLLLLLLLRVCLLREIELRLLHSQGHARQTIGETGHGERSHGRVDAVLICRVLLLLLVRLWLTSLHAGARTGETCTTARAGTEM
jgi:hypothetical protein